MPSFQGSQDNVNHPAHYAFSKIEVIDAIEEWNLDFHSGNIVKYVVRHTRKGNPIEDLKKARWYIERRIALLESQSNTEQELSNAEMYLYTHR
jgi:hypothetical protein